MLVLMTSIRLNDAAARLMAPTIDGASTGYAAKRSGLNAKV